MRLYWLIAALISALTLASMHLWALHDFLYWRLRWFDTPMHILGGVSIALFVVALLHVYRPRVFIGIVIIAFIAWEIFEAILGIAVQPGVNYTLDTIHDLANDGIGATLVYIAARLSIWRPVANPLTLSHE